MTTVAPPRPTPGPTRGPLRHLVEVVAAVVDARGSLRALALLRLALGPVVVLHLWPTARRLLDGRRFDDTFHVPWSGFVPDVPGEVQVVAVTVGVLGGIALGFGAFTSIAAPLTWVAVATNLFLSQHHYGQNRAFLLYLLGAVALSDSGRVLSVDAWRRRRAGIASAGDVGWIWPLLLARVLASAVYFSSGASKLLDADWIGGLVLWDRSVRYQALVRDHDLLGAIGLADPIADLVTQRWVHTVTSPVIVTTELVIAAGLWFGRTRLVSVWLAVAFHLSIELTAEVEVFSLAGLAALGLWATPSTRDRVLRADPDSTAVRVVRRLDWLARFRIESRPGVDARDGHELAVVDRDGTVRTGPDARWVLWSRLPVTFVVLGPLLAVRAWRARRTSA